MKRSRNVIILLIVTIIAIIAVAVMIFSPLINLETYNGVNNFGLAIHPIYPSFSSSEQGFTINNNLLSASDYAIYKMGYYSINGGAWVPFTLSGTVLSGNWLTGNANANLPNFPTGESYIVIYSCSKNISTGTTTWNCHDGAAGRWQLQIINIAASTNSSNITWSDELMMNEGFEQGNLNYWTTSGLAWKVGNHLNNSQFAYPQKGNYQVYINGSSDVNGYIYQDVDLTNYANYIDAGTVVVNASGWGVSSESPDQDMSRVQIIFLNSAKGIIATTVDSGDVNSGIWWQKGIYNYAIPNGTRYIRMWGNTYEQGYSSGSLDSFSVKVGYGGTPIISPICTPITCSSQHKNCGNINDGCGNAITCGNCVLPQTCGGAGNANVCGIPNTCVASNYTPALNTFCGSKTVKDNCNISSTKTGTIICSTPQTCGGAGNANVCGKATTSGTTYYISASTGASDSNSGTQSSPWKTLSYACSKVSASGSVIHVNAGTYIETARCNLAPGVSIEGEGDSSLIKAHYKDLGSSSYSSDAFIYMYSSSVTNGNQHISYIKLDGELTGTRAIYEINRENLEIHHCTVNNFLYNGIRFDGFDQYDSTPTTWLHGNSFHDNTMSNNAYSDSTGSFSNGNLDIVQQQGFLCYNNVFTQTGRSSGHNGELVKTTDAKGLLFYNNVCNSALENGDWWNFIGEWWNERGGVEVYNNTFNGAATFDVAGIWTEKNEYNFSVKIHDNEFIIPNQVKYNPHGVIAICLEAGQSLDSIYVYNNHFKNFAETIQITMGMDSYTDSTVDNIFIYDNILERVGYSDGVYSTSAIALTKQKNNILHNNNIKIWNNVISGGTTYSATGIRYDGYSQNNDISIQNNIIQGFSSYPIIVRDEYPGSMNNLQITNNLYYNNGINSATVESGISVTNSPNLNKNNIVGNPSFIDATNNNFHLNSNSPAIGKGVNVGLITDRDGQVNNNPPSIGAYEYP